MKHGKRPNRRQKQIIHKAGLNAENWLVTKSLPTHLHLIHRYGSDTKIIVI
ncbi:DUF6906 family protein [Paenibacillus sp. GXUN7292]|uniref:DUF6906 family protein n=1 Tax=Paenibacillus sp. GXUN7292 TaxID=3422499 RepID=UPI003D7CB82C